MSDETEAGGGAKAKREVATLGGGCFWCVEAVFDMLRGVESVESGYAGGTVEHPSYQHVCTGETGHAEVVRVTFDPDEISFREILEVFFSAHDPTTLNRQGADVGTQYRSVVFYHDEGQRRVAEEVMREIDESNIWDGRVVTELAPFEKFYEAEDYHQEYFANNPGQGYCRVVVAPKVKKFRERFRDRLKDA
ncbi:MAG TPA: peptide-methionine (S)-S-oxide reductase MsrA [Pyrinomonadaceae bacterium]|nr:peptide-methionine (S)-S-oxide reductase MsrA [Pyrinomonadaceae bacterium]